MTPLSASLIFVFISILISAFRHLFSSNSSMNSNDDSNIAFVKLHTITITQAQQQKQPYNSLYQAYFKPQIPKELQTPLPYSSFAFKKSVLNNEGVYLCQEKFAAIFEERTSCENTNKSCKWKTLVTVYRLPFLKKEESQSLQVDGRILSNDFGDELVCRARQTRLESFELNFVVILNPKESKKGAGWTMHSLIIEEERQSWRREGPFHLRLLKWNLKNINHYPSQHSFDQKCLSYVTKEEPWLIHYNCNSRWEGYNILSPDVQKVIFPSNNTKTPPFQPSLQISPIFLKHFRSSQKLYTRPDGCTGICPRQEHVQEHSFITYVFQITNSPLKFGKTFAQMTITLTNGKNAKLVSYNMLESDFNLQKKTQFDCLLTSKEYRLVKGFYTYQIGPHVEDNLVATFFKHSLLCVCSQSLIEDLNVIEVQDLIGNFNMTDNPPQLNLRSKEAMELRKLEHMFYRKQALMKKKQEPKEQNSWLDLGLFDFKYDIEENSEGGHDALVDNDADQETDQQDQLEDSEKKDKRIKIKKKQQKKRNKKSRKDRKDEEKQAIKFSDDAVGERLEELHDNFAEIGEVDPFEGASNIILVPMPLLLNTENKLKIVSGDTEYPLVYMESSNKKFLMTYQLKEDEQSGANQTQRQSYTYKYAQIGADPKSPELHISLDLNETHKKHREEELELDRFLLSVLEHNGNIMNKVKSVTTVEARYDEGSKQVGLKGFVKPHCRHVIIAWGWGLEVYEINWDRKGLKSQIAEIQEQLNSKTEGVEMATLLPFIELFATVYCLFQALITSR